MIGDSITDANRQRPGGNALGEGYVSLIDAYLTANWPERRIRVINKGVSGNTARDLAARWRSDATALDPDWLSIMIGINDVWRQFDQPLDSAQHVGLAEYAQTLESLVSAVRPSLKGLVLMTPYFLEPNDAEPMRAMMDRYGAAVRELAARHDAVFVDTQAAFAPIMRRLHPMALAWDRVHPNLTGHLILARAFLASVDGGC